MPFKFHWPWLTWIIISLVAWLAYGQPPPMPPLLSIANPPVITIAPQVVTNDVTPPPTNSMMIYFGRQNCIYPQTNYFIFHFRVVSNHVITVEYKGVKNTVDIEEKAVLRKFKTEVMEILEAPRSTKTIKETEE